MRPRTAIGLAALAAFLAKLFCAVTTVGTNDADSFYNFGQFIAENGLLTQYRATAAFNHTPLVGWFCAAAYGIGYGFGFNLLLRLPGILADLLAVAVLLRWREETGSPPGWALLLFALSPVNFMISGFHGNVDAVLAVLLLLAVRESARDRAVWCGVFFGLACQIKVIPVLLAPALFFFWLARGRGAAFFLPATATILIGWSVPLIALPEIFLHNVLGYSSNWGSWGVTHWLQASGWPPFAPVGFQGLTPAQTAVMAVLKGMIVIAAIGFGWQRRKRPAAELPATLMMIWAVFFALAPGIGAQYLVWFGPLLLLHSARWFAVITAASAVFLFAFYTTICGGLPWSRGISTAELLPHWVAWTTLPWLAVLAFLIWAWSQSSSSSSSSGPSESSSGGSSWSL